MIGPAVAEGVREVTDGRRADVEAHEIRGDRVALDDLARRGVGRARHHRVDGQPEIHAPRPRLLEEVAGRVDQVASRSERPTSWPWARRNVKAIPPPISRRSTRPRSDSIRASLSETLAPPRIATSGRAGASKIRASAVELLLHQEPGHGRPEMPRDALRRGVGPVRGGEGVVHVDVAEPRQRARERGIVRLLARVEAEVLQEEHAARRQRRGLALDGRADAVGGQRDAAPRGAPRGGAPRGRARTSPPARPWGGRGARRRPSRAPPASARGGAWAGPPGSARPRSPRRRARAGR